MDTPHAASNSGSYNQQLIEGALRQELAEAQREAADANARGENMARMVAREVARARGPRSPSCTAAQRAPFAQLHPNGRGAAPL
eukprot:3962354-Prymnesium_polylepis.1